MTSRTAIALIVLAQIVGAGVSPAQSSNVVGSWIVQVTFENGQTHKLRFDARASGKGSFVSLAPKPIQVGPTGHSAAAWSQEDEHSLTMSGPVQFPIGNVGIDRGTLLLKGKFETDGSMTGEAKFFPQDQDPQIPKATPSKSGVFKATRIAD